MGREVVVAVTAGKLDFGPWEQIFYGEFDGRRKKRVLVKIIGEQSLKIKNHILLRGFLVLNFLKNKSQKNRILPKEPVFDFVEAK